MPSKTELVTLIQFIIKLRINHNRFIYKNKDNFINF